MLHKLNKNVDTTSPITHISLCAGYGGIDLGLKRAIPSIRTILFSEIEAFVCAFLVSKMEAGLLDAAPVWSNLKTLPWDQFCGKVDILSGGFPCQPFSCAGKRDGDEDPRHLFPYILDGIRRCRPSVVFLENVEGILSAKLTGDNWRDPAGTPVLLHVLRELERVGYRATAGVFSACETGASHQRKRVFIMAHSINTGSQGCASIKVNKGRVQFTLGRGGDSIWPSRPGQPQFSWEPPRVVGNASNTRHAGAKGCSGTAEEGQPIGHATEPVGDEYIRKTEPSLGGDPNGPSNRVGHAELQVSCDNRTDELRLLGNGVVPATAELAFRTLWRELTA
jgi:DNA (cytosine-5)-methyltransferase 1